MGKVPLLLRDVQQSAAVLRLYQGVQLLRRQLLVRVRGWREVALLRFQVQQLRSRL
jgi:hypothetical protein